MIHLSLKLLGFKIQLLVVKRKVLLRVLLFLQKISACKTVFHGLNLELFLALVRIGTVYHDQRAVRSSVS